MSRVWPGLDVNSQAPVSAVSSWRKSARFQSFALTDALCICGTWQHNDSSLIDFKVTESENKHLQLRWPPHPEEGLKQQQIKGAQSADKTKRFAEINPS